ncbi:MAG: MaoC family dehydratase [Acidobacteriota bacterium]
MSTNQTTLDALAERIGQELTVSDWVQVKQQRIDDFAKVIGDEQWIHVDKLRAAAESPYETTVAHGFLLLSLIGHMLRQQIEVTDSPMNLDYGLDRVRFTQPVHAGAVVRGRFVVKQVRQHEDGLLVTWDVTIERQHVEKPVCLAEWVVLYSRQGASHA